MHIANLIWIDELKYEPREVYKCKCMSTNLSLHGDVIEWCQTRIRSHGGRVESQYEWVTSYWKLKPYHRCFL